MPKIIIVSGGSDGLGKEIAKTLSAVHKVIILAHNETKLKAVSTEIGCGYVVADVTKYDQIEKAIGQVVEKHGRIDSLINCAGVWAQGKITNNTPQEIEELLNVNTQGTIFLCKAVIPQMEKQGIGDIVNIISQDGLYAKKDRSLYHASKWAITGFTKCLQKDISEKNIRVTGIYPGLMNTSLFEKKGVRRDLTHSLELADVARLVEFVINLSPDTHIPEIGIKHLLNTDTNMDDSGTGLDLNLDPDLITTQSGPQVTPTDTTTPPVPAPATEPPTGIIDITPRSASASTPISPTDTPTPISSPPAEEIPQPLPPLPTLPAEPTSPEPLSVPPTEEVPLSPPETPPQTILAPHSEQTTLPPLPVSQSPTEPIGDSLPPALPPLPGETVTPAPSDTPSPGQLPGNPQLMNDASKVVSSFTIDTSSTIFENPDDVKVAK